MVCKINYNKVLQIKKNCCFIGSYQLLSVVAPYNFNIKMYLESLIS